MPIRTHITSYLYRGSRGTIHALTPLTPSGRTSRNHYYLPTRWTGPFPAIIAAVIMPPCPQARRRPTLGGKSVETNRNIQPQKGANRFSCPHCEVVAKQDWMSVHQISEVYKHVLWSYFFDYRRNIASDTEKKIDAFCNHFSDGIYDSMTRNFIPGTYYFAKCQSCSETSIWISETMIYPRSLPVPGPNEDMDDEIKKLYLEAATIYQDSSRASAALLRLCIEKLCNQLGEKGRLDDCIAALVQKGITKKIQQALDYCRVIGNNAIHPGQIDLEDDSNKVFILFDLVNDIADEMITKPKEMEDKYSSLPERVRESIEKRDSRASQSSPNS